MPLVKEREIKLKWVIESSIQAFAASDWNVCAGENPYVSHGFFLALEASGALGHEQGVVPQYVGLRDEAGQLLVCAPGLLKWGNKLEFGPEIRWLIAGETQGVFNWPKFQLGVPFCQARGPKILVRLGWPLEKLQDILLEALQNKTQTLNIMLCSEQEAARLSQRGWLFSHETWSVWHNPGYVDYNAYLKTLSKHRRSRVLRERRDAQQSGANIRILTGADLPDSFWPVFFEGNRRVRASYGFQPWLPERFYVRLARELPHAIRLFAAFEGEAFLAGTLCLVDQTTLYADTWSALCPVGPLTFELLCHRPMVYAIDHGLLRIETGLAAPHKTLRGFAEEKVPNAHWFESATLRELAMRELNR